MAIFDKTNWRTQKIISLEEMREKAVTLKKQGKSTVTVNGAFDLLHAGHLDQLEEAKKQGDVLFVGINSDESIKGYKGQDRPYIAEQARAAMLAALICVDYVVIIEGEAKEIQNILLRAVKPNIHVNGAEYGDPKEWIEYPVMKEVGAKGFTAAKLNDLSTTDIIKKIRG